MRWPLVTLGDYVKKIGSGITPRGGDSVYVSSGTALIRSQNVYNNTFQNGGLAYISEDQAERMRGVTVLPGDLLLNITGDSVARCCMVPNKYLPARVNQHVSIIRPKHEEIDSRFLMYFLTSSYMQARMLSLAGSGGTRKALTKGIIGKFSVPRPSITTQKSIVETLSQYDNLIENNRRRIALLEEAARQLYKEWFVHFRFPGHTYTKTIDGIPQGWERATLGEIAVIRKGKNITRDKARYGDVPVVAGGLKPAYFHSTANVVGPVITISASGANAGHVALYHIDIWASDCSFLGINENTDIWFLYLLLKWHQAEITAMQQGAAQPHVYPKHLQRLDIVVPHSKVRKLFHERVGDSFRQIAVLKRQSQILEQARDILLPKLMSGEIAV